MIQRNPYMRQITHAVQHSNGTPKDALMAVGIVVGIVIIIFIIAKALDKWYNR